MNLIDQQKVLFDSGAAVNAMYNAIPASDPFKNVYLGLMSPNRPPEVEEFLATREAMMQDSNAISRAFRKDTRGLKEFPDIGELRKSGLAPISKANLDVGTLTNFASITGGQSLGYVSLDVQMARGTVRPGSFTLYQALHKTRAYQVVDYWAYASDTGGPLPGAAFQGFSSVGTGTLSTSAGKYLLENITLKLAVNGRAITTALAAQNSFVDVTAQENINAALSVLESLNWASYWGQPSIFANQFLGAYTQINSFNPSPSGAQNGQNTIDFQAWNNSYASAQGWSPQQSLFNLIYQWAGQITNYNNFGRITHAFMSPSCAGSLQGLATTLLNNIVAGFGSNSEAQPIVVNGDLQGMHTRFGAIQFPIDMYITARDAPAQAIKNSDGTNNATSSAPTPPASVAVTTSGAASAGSAWTAAYVASSGWYTYAVAACDASMNESTLAWAAPVSGIVAGRSNTVAITGGAATDFVAFRVYRSGLGEQMTATSPFNPAAVRYIGTVAGSGSGVAASFVDLNTKIPGGETLFLFDMDEQDMAIDYRYLLPLTKIDLFAQNLFMPWAVTSIGGVRVRVPKFHGLIINYVGDNPTFNPLSTNTYTIL